MGLGDIVVSVTSIAQWKVFSFQGDCSGVSIGSSLPMDPRSIEQRERDYEEAKARIFSGDVALPKEGTEQRWEFDVVGLVTCLSHDTCLCSSESVDLSVCTDSLSGGSGPTCMSAVDREKGEDSSSMGTPPSVRKGGGAGRRRGNFRNPGSAYQSFSPSGMLEFGLSCDYCVTPVCMTTMLSLTSLFLFHSAFFPQVPAQFVQGAYWTPSSMYSASPYIQPSRSGNIAPLMMSPTPGGYPIYMAPSPHQPPVSPVQRHPQQQQPVFVSPLGNAGQFVSPQLPSPQVQYTPKVSRCLLCSIICNWYVSLPPTDNICGFT